MEPASSSEPPLRVLYQDELLVAVVKPSGLAVHRGWAKEATYALTQTRDLVGRHVHPVHRLDRATSGILVFAFDAEGTRSLQHALSGDQEHRAEKRYLAIVRGHAPEERYIDYAVRKGEKRGPDAPRLEAQTSVRRLGCWERYSLLEALPHTGRLHQIRRHLHHISHPIIGDTRYGKGEHNRLFRERFGLHRLALHASSLRFRHPTSREWIHLHVSPEGPLRSTLEAMGLWDEARALGAPSGGDRGAAPC